MSSPVQTIPTNELLDPVTVTEPQGPLSQIFGRVRLTTGWQKFMSDVSNYLISLTSSGTSANRPTKLLYTGRPYYDTTLDSNLHLKSVNPVVWIGSAFRHKSSDTTRSSTTVLADDPELTLPILANEEFVGMLHLDVGAAIKTTGIKVAITAPSGASGHFCASIITDAISAGEVFLIRSDTPGAALDFTTADLGNSLNGMIDLHFHVPNGPNDGNITLQWAQSTSSGTGLTIRTGSRMEAEKVA